MIYDQQVKGIVERPLNRWDHKSLALHDYVNTTVLATDQDEFAECEKWMLGAAIEEGAALLTGIDQKKYYWFRAWELWYASLECLQNNMQAYLTLMEAKEKVLTTIYKQSGEISVDSVLRSIEDTWGVQRLLMRSILHARTNSGY